MADDSLITTPLIKQEPEDSSLAPKFVPGEIIDLISDDEEDVPPAASRPQLGSPFLGRHSGQAPDPLPLNLGPSVLSEPKKAAPKKMTVKERMREVARNTAQQFREEPAQNAQHTPVRFGRSELFVTESDPGTPDAAQQFLDYKQEIDDKRRNNTLSIEEDIKFRRAQAEEDVRVLQERANIGYERSPSPVEDDENLSAVEPTLAVPGLESADDEPAPPKGGRKRKAPAAQPEKRGKQAKNAKADAKAEGILEKARRKLEQKGKGKGKVKAKETAKAPKRGRKPKYSGPSMMNADNLFDRTDVVDDAAHNADIANPPTFDTEQQPTRKDAAFRQLLASVPVMNRKIANIDMKYFKEQLKSFTGQGHSVRPAANGSDWELKGLRVSLKAYQILGIAWMRQRELSRDEPRGGILGDQMGLGKTVMMLGNIINGKPLQKSNCRTTLIVASPALINQWSREISEKVYSRHEDKKHGIGRFMEYHTSATIKGNEELEMLKECDVVLTTYHQVCKSYPKEPPPADLVTAEQKLKWWKKYYDENKGALHRIKFSRIILDEAQAIKNRKSLTARACSAVEAVHHWSISGTIVMNHLNEFYPQFRFLRVPFTESFKIFKDNYTSPDDPDGTNKLKARLSQFLIRRTHRDTLFNAKLLVLPTPSQHSQWVEFNPIERVVYDIVKARFIVKINGISRRGELDKKYGFIWSMLLRLRQLASHVLLIQSTLVDLLELQDFERLRAISGEDLSGESRSLLNQLHQTLKDGTGTKGLNSVDGNITVTENENAPIDQIYSDPAVKDLGGNYGLTYNFGRYLDSLKESESFEEICQRALCNGCRQPPLDPHVTSCYHIYCHPCLVDLQASSARRGSDRHRCTECGEFYTDAKPCEKELEPYTVDHEAIASGSQDTGLGAQVPNKKSTPPSWLAMKGQILPSAKTIALKARVLSWLEEDPDCRIIIYSQFLGMIALLKKICVTEGWSAEKYTGTMTQDSRRKALENFADPKKKVKILLASLRCGGIGLNLTMASRVITLDPWWNSSVEQQAFCRVYRIGQEKETQMTRLLVRNTIDEAVMALQESKQISIDAAMDESKRKEKIPLPELMRLFGRVHKDENGRPFIFAHGDDDDAENAAFPPAPAAERPSDEEGDGIVDDY